MGRVKLMSKKEQLPVWDLKMLYKSIDDPKIKSDSKKLLADAGKFAKRYKGTIARLSASQLLTAIKTMEQIFASAAKLYMYPMLMVSVDSQNPELNVLFQQVSSLITEVQGQFIFFDLEIMELPTSRINSLLSDKSLANYKHYLQTITKYRTHHLSETEERIFNDKSLTSGSALNRIFDQHMAKKKFEIRHSGSNLPMSTEEVMTWLSDADRSKRKAAAEGFTKGLQTDAQLLTTIFNTLIKDKAINDRWHKFLSPEESRHLSNEIDQQTVDTMVETVERGYGLVEDFYKFKSKVMKLPRLYIYDRYAPIAETQKRYSFEEAKNIVLTAFNRFSPEFGKIAKEFFDKRWIHAPVTTGKRAGAFCASITPDTHPVVLVNYLGKDRDVQTLAHELGHGINGYLSRKQTYLNYDNPLTMAETASVFCEMLVFDDLKERVRDPKEKFAMYMQKIQDTFATVFRQTSMHKFEQDVHRLQKGKGELTTDEINVLWVKRQQEMFGSAVDLSGSEQWWSYIPHFLHTPFYVYAYSFGELMVLSLYAQYKQDPISFVPKYLELMSAGSSKSPKELLAPFGIDLENRKFWEGGLNIIKEMIAEAKEVYKTIYN